MSARKSGNARAKADAVAVLIAAGWREDGETATQAYRQGTAASPVYGNTGGELVVVGGRQRFVQPETGMKVTVGAVTTCFYTVTDGKPRYHVTLPTKEIERIRSWSDGIAHKTTA